MWIFLITVLLFSTKLANCHSAIHYPNYKNHECKRKCIEGVTKVCKYEFVVEELVSMMPDCENCPHNETDCFNDNCIMVDGNRATVIVFNRMLPGPSIEVCQNDTIDVTVRNHLEDQSISIHWHGVYQKGNVEMDGTPMVTQWPIIPGTSFNYKFNAAQKGTQLYHSHSGFQRLYGMYGPLIIRTPRNKHQKTLYDFDLSEHAMTFSDWAAGDPVELFYKFFRMKMDEGETVSEMLINSYSASANNSMPIPRFTVRQGYKYRFRLIYAGFTMCSMQIQFQNHNMTVINLDGEDVEPKTVDAIYFTPGERVDVVINANKDVGFYWIIVTGVGACPTRRNIALLEYESTTPLIVPNRKESNIEMSGKKKLNCINEFSNHSNCIQISELKSVREPDESLKEVADITHHFVYKLYTYAKPEFSGRNDENLTNPAINMIIHEDARSPLIYGESGAKICNGANKRVCNKNSTFCQCTHVVELPMNKTIELIIVNEDNENAVTHPMHLHGYGFRIIADEKLHSNISLELVKELDRNNMLKRNFDRPPIKDSFTQPNNGYSILRFYTDNPGYWAFHCHVEIHMELGMTLIFKVGNTTKLDSPTYRTWGDISKSNISHITKKQHYSHNKLVTNSIFSTKHLYN